MLAREQVNKIIDEHQYCHRIDMAPLEYEEVLAISKGEMADIKVYEDDGLDDGAMLRTNTFGKIFSVRSGIMSALRIWRLNYAR